MFQKHQYKSGDLVVYTISKLSPQPGPRARSVLPLECGDDYSYVVDKYWMVVEADENGKVLIVTRTGKTRTVSASDPLLRKASWWQLLRFRDRFPRADLLQSQQDPRVSG